MSSTLFSMQQATSLAMVQFILRDCLQKYYYYMRETEIEVRIQEENMFIQSRIETT